MCCKLLATGAQAGNLTGITGGFDGAVVYYVVENGAQCLIYKAISADDGKIGKGVPDEALNKYLEGYKVKTPFLTYDGRFLYFSASNAETRGFDIFCTRREGDQWTKPQAVPVLSSEYDDLSPSLPANNLTVYFVRHNPEIECLSIYTSNRENTNWSLPQLLPPPINAGCEPFVQISPAGEIMLFASDRLLDKKKKKYSLFASTLAGKVWLPPVAVEEAVNEHSNPNAFIVKNKIMIATPTVDGVAVNEASRVASASCTRLVGTVKDEYGKPLAVEITVRDCYTNAIDTKSTNDPITGEYSLTIPNGGLYSVACRKKLGPEKSEIINTIDNVPEQNVHKDIVIASRAKLSVNVRDGINNKAIDADIKVFDKNETVKTTHLKTGVYELEIPVFENIEIEISQKNYLKENLNINLNSSPEFYEIYHEISLKPDLRPGKLKITDLVSNKGLNAGVKVKNLDAADEKIFINSSSTGIYEFNIRKNNKYSISVAMKGYFYYYTVWEADAHRISQSMEVKPVPLNETGKIAMTNLIFEPGESNLSPEATGELECVVNVLQHNPEYDVNITLYHSATEKEQTQNRIRTVSSFMESQQIPKTRYKIDAIAGNTKPEIQFVKKR
jgi:hypothetical protein